MKAQLHGFENPKIYKSKSTKEVIQADLSFTKHYTEIALKEDNHKKLVVKWKVLSFMASMKKGKLHLLTPRGHRVFTQKLIDRYNISAVIHSI